MRIFIIFISAVEFLDACSKDTDGNDCCKQECITREEQEQQFVTFGQYKGNFEIPRDRIDLTLLI